jgi:hypothetical protein
MKNNHLLHVLLEVRVRRFICCANALEHRVGIIPAGHRRAIRQVVLGTRGKMVLCSAAHYIRV